MKHELEIAAKLGITLKKIGTFKGHEGMTGINAEICLNGKAFAHAYDDARGGPLDIDPIGYSEENKKTIKNVETQLLDFPEYAIKLGDNTFMTRCTLEDLVNALVDNHLQKQSLKKDEKKGILFENSNGGSSLVTWPLGTIPKMIEKYGAAQVVDKLLQPTYNDYKSNGKKILNVEYLKKIGVKI